jgi:arylsulfatase A-like enzyme
MGKKIVLVKKKVIWFFAFGVVLSFMVILGRWLVHDSRHYLRGDVIRLIDDMDDECILRSPIAMPLRPVRKELLDQGWIKLGSLANGIAIWRTSTSRFIVSPFDRSPDSSQSVYRQDRILKHQPDLWSPKTAVDCWNFQDNQIFISAEKGENPNRKKYFTDYRTFEEANFIAVEEERLNNPLTYTQFHDGQSVRRLVIFPVRFPMWKQFSDGEPFRTVIRQNKKILPFQQGLPERLNPPLEKSLLIYRTDSSPAAEPYPLFRSSDKLCKYIQVVPGPCIIKFMARASLAGSEPPLAVVKLGGREVARLPIASEDWQRYYVSALIEQADTEFCIEFPNDYYDPQNHRDRNIFISEVLLWPDWAPDEIRLKTVPGGSQPTTWSWLDDGEDVFYEATPRTVFKIYNKEHVFSSKRFFQMGIVSILITASADLSGREKPRLAVYLDKKRVGAIQIEDNTFREYTLGDIPVTAGWHVMKTVFENDFYDPATQEDRNIFLKRVALRRQSAVMISEPADKPSAKYSISYLSRASLLNKLHVYRRYSIQEADRINPVAWRVDLEGEIRKALVCPPQTKLVFRIKVPPSGKLRFGYGSDFVPVSQSKSQTSSCPDELSIKLREVFHAARTIFSIKIKGTPSGRASPWRDEVLDLGAFVGKRVEVFIESLSHDQGLGIHPDLFVSNPVISADTRRIQSDPNVVIIAADALRADHLSCYGYERQTSPNIDQFAGESVLFQSAISQASWTLPSFISLFTSLEPSFHGILSGNARLHSSVKTLPKILQKNGYLTAASVDNPHLFPAIGLAEGFDLYSYRNTDVEGQLATIGSWLDSMKGQKFFLFIHLISTHLPYAPPAPYAAAFRKADRPISTHLPYAPPPPYAAALRKADRLTAMASARTIYELDRTCKRLSFAHRTDLIALYDGEILYLDDILRRLFASMKQLDLYRDTLVVFLSDHGEQFQEHGYLSHGKTLYQEEILVPLIMKLPAGTRYEAKRIPAVVRTIDIFPTICDILRIQPSDTIRGKSLVPLLRGQAFEEGVVFSELPGYGKLAIKKGQYKYIYTDQKVCAWTMKNMNRLNCWPTADEELYDLNEDPGESRNIAAVRPDLLEIFRKERKHFAEISHKFRQSAKKARENDRTVLDQATTERLRALGYIR